MNIEYARSSRSNSTQGQMENELMAINVAAGQESMAGRQGEVRQGSKANKHNGERIQQSNVNSAENMSGCAAIICMISLTHITSVVVWKLVLVNMRSGFQLGKCILSIQSIKQ